MEITNMGESHNDRNNRNLSVVHDEDEKCNATVDLCDLTLSSFSDVLLGDCSYFGDDSISGSNKGSDIKHDVQRIIDDNLQTCSDSEQKLDDYNFYHVFEVIDNLRDKDNLKNHRKSHRRHKKSRTVTGAPIKKGQRYLPNFKQRVLDYASNHTFKATALHFNINCNTITEWARESKRLSQQQKSTRSMPDDSVCHYKTDILCTPAMTTTTTKTDIIIINDSFTIETDINDDNNMLKGEGGSGNKDLTMPSQGEMVMKSDERFLEWIRMKRHEGKELSRSEVYNAALDCANVSHGTGKDPLWFMLWLKRYNKTLGKVSEKTDQETDKYIMYPNNFKIEVALYAKSFTKNSAARVFNVPRRRIFDWFKCWDDSGATKAEDTTGNGNKTRRQIYTELHDWYKKKLSEGFSPNSKEIKAKARELFNANGIIDLKFSEGWLQKFCKRLNIKLRHTDDDDLLLWILAQFDNNVSLSHQEITDKSSKLIGKRREFKGSKGWTLRFLKRHSNFLQHVPTHDDKLPEIVHSKIRDFLTDFRYALAAHNISIGSIGCMDEIPITFSYPQDGKATNLPLLRKTGFENCQAVVILCVLADGRALPPTVVLRGKGPRQVLSIGQVDTLVMFQESGVVDYDVIDSWTRDVWLSCVPSPSILVLDSFQPHCSMRDGLRVNNSFAAVIPEGCSSQLQPLDVEVTPKFREMIKSQWKESEAVYASKTGKPCRCPDQDTILGWIRTAYQRIEENPYSITKSFKVVGLID